MAICSAAVRTDEDTLKDKSLSGDLSGKYMAFKLSEEEYGLDIMDVREILELMDITRVPRTKPFIRGVINLRGKVIPVIDLRKFFEMESREDTEQTVIIVVKYTFDDRNINVGFLVDEVLEVLSVSSAQIEPPPAFGSGSLGTSFILGVAMVDERLIFLLDMGKVLQKNESDYNFSS